MTRTGICRFHFVEPRQGSATQALLARTNGFAFTRNGVAYSKKDKQRCLSFLLVTRTGLEPMLPPWKGGVLTAWPTGRYEALYRAEYIKRITSCICVVAAMRFELMTYRVWTDRSNQLSYAAIWLRRKDSNPRPSGYEPDELPDCSTPRYIYVLSWTADFSSFQSNSLTIILKISSFVNCFYAFFWLFF